MIFTYLYVTFSAVYKQINKDKSILYYHNLYLRGISNRMAESNLRDRHTMELKSPKRSLTLMQTGNLLNEKRRINVKNEKFTFKNLFKGN